jgi:predicted  nucleic acid-binding Zn-ribbon protein
MSGAAAVAAVAEPQDARAVLRQAIAARQAARAKLADAEQAAKRSETMLKAIEAEIAKSSSAIESDTADEVASQIRDGSEAGQLSPALADRRRQRDELLEQAGRLRSAQKRLAADVETARAALQRSEVAAIESAEQILIDEAVERVARIEAALGTLKRDGTMLAGLCAIRLGASGMRCG